MKKFLTTAALLAGIAFAPAAQATVLSWNYSVDSTFVDPQFEGVLGGTGTGFTTQSDYDLSWGSAENRSALAIRGDDSAFTGTGGPATGIVFTNGDFVPANTFYHNNQPIPITSRALRSVTSPVSFDLTALTPPELAGNISPTIPDFLINFRETPNVSGASCESGVGSCADIFVVEVNVPFIDGFFTFDFDYEGETYFVDLMAQGLTLLTAQQCDAAGAEAGCVGIITNEGQLNSALFSFRIRADIDEVPEPAAVGLLGLGLLGAAGLRRRKA